MLAGKTYAPLLRTKPAEITAFQTLSAQQKDVIFPVFLAKPWQNANWFQKTIDRVCGAVGARPFGFALDRAFLGASNTRHAQQEFDQLFGGGAGFRTYYDLVEALDGAVPVFIRSDTADQTLLQLGNADALGRGLIVHFVRGEVTPVLNLAGAVPPLPHDTVFIVDAGWSRDLIQLEQWAAQTVQRIVAAVPNPEIIVMASTFPDSFGHIVGHGTIDLHEGQLFGLVRQRFNQANLTYGDWATTRPPQSGGGGTIPPRIDVPGAGLCHVFRADSDQDETYAEVADLARAHACLANVPDCYGRTLIETTAPGAGITGTQRSTEARINIHMTLIAGAQGISTAEEEYVD